MAGDRSRRIGELFDRAGKAWLALVGGFILTGVSIWQALMGHGSAWRWAFFAALTFTAAFLWVAYGALKERDKALTTPEKQLESALKTALGLRERLTYYDDPEPEMRRDVMALIIESQSKVAEFAPQYVDDLETEQVEGAGKGQLLGVVNEYYRVLSAVRKQL